jgi:hypothetical protein
MDNAEHVPAVKMHPRTQWEDVNRTGLKDPHGDLITTVRAHLAMSTFHPDNTFLLVFADISSRLRSFCACEFHTHMQHIHSSALTTLTADDFAAEMSRRKINSSLAVAFVRLTGLVRKAHLNGREGILHERLVFLGRDPNNSERFAVRLENGKNISVSSQNFEPVHRPKVLNEDRIMCASCSTCAGAPSAPICSCAL